MAYRTIPRFYDVRQGKDDAIALRDLNISLRELYAGIESLGAQLRGLSAALRLEAGVMQIASAQPTTVLFSAPFEAVPLVLLTPRANIPAAITACAVVLAASATGFQAGLRGWEGPISCQYLAYCP